MGKPKTERRLDETAAMAKARTVRSSARKLNIVAGLIRGKKAEQALTLLNFEKRRCAQDVKKVLQAAIANAENNHQLDVDKLYVAEAWVGRAFILKRFMARGRGRSTGIEKPYSNLTIVVREGEIKTKRTAKKAAEKTALKTEGKKTAKTKSQAEKTGA
jgi:large subunit ribosomal protein L22